MNSITFLASWICFSLTSPQLPHFSVRGDSLYPITPERKVKMIQAMALFEKVMNDPAFQQELQTTKFLFDVHNDENSKLSTQQIVAKLYAGKEFYKPDEDNTANLYWNIYLKPDRPRGNWVAVGYGNEYAKEINTYSWFFDDPDLPAIAGHIAHEWSHKVGFKHKFHPHKGREGTVPYAFGDLVVKYAKRLL